MPNQITTEEYKRVCNVGDYIKTNGDGNSGSFGTRTGKVVKKTDTRFFIRLENNNGDDWVVDFSANSNPNAHGLLLRAWVEIIKPYKNIKLKKMKTGSQRKMEITLKKEKDKLSVFIKVPAEIEKFYKDQCPEIEQSDKWKSANGEGVKFQKLTMPLKELERDINLDTFSNFGAGLFDGGRINTAMLRTVGASQGVEVFSTSFKSISNADQDFYIRKLVQFTKKLWEENISERILKSVITFEF